MRYGVGEGDWKHGSIVVGREVSGTKSSSMAVTVLMWLKGRWGVLAGGRCMTV